MKKINFLWVALATAAGIAACGDSSTVEVTDAGVADSGVKDSGSQTDTGVIDAGTVDATPAPTCTDRIKNGTEADIDCGGSCAAKCGDGKACAATKDCTSGVCTNKVCAAPACTDAVKNGTEADVDCGGSCATKCGDGKACAAAGDCTSGACSANVCASPACIDSVKNGSETDVDCGGACPAKCGDGKACAATTDCGSGVCTNGACVAAACNDAVKNGNEADVDCGGACAAKCGDGKACGAAGDCGSGVCVNGTCAVAACDDAVKNGNEADIDCGGACAVKCGDGKACGAASDCGSGVCTNGTCAAPACADGIKNGGETDVDCGGVCATKCAVGKACAASADCGSGAVCTGNVCVLPTSCKSILAGKPGIASGVYTLDPDGAGAKPSFQAYCDMVSDGGGWTLALKADGAKQTFTYAAPLWTNATLLATDKPDLDKNEAKLATWNDIAFADVRVAIVDANVTRAVKIPKASASLAAIFTPNAFVATNLGRASWLGLMAAPSLQLNCNQEGFSLASQVSVRIGIIGNQENDCGSPDSWIGIGGTGAPCNGALNTSTTGNIATCAAVDKATAAFGYVFVR